MRNCDEKRIQALRNELSDTRPGDTSQWGMKAKLILTLVGRRICVVLDQCQFRSANMKRLLSQFCFYKHRIYCFDNIFTDSRALLMRHWARISWWLSIIHNCSRNIYWLTSADNRIFFTLVGFHLKSNEGS